MKKQSISILERFRVDSVADKVVYVFMTAARKLDIMSEFIADLERRDAKVFVFATPNARKMMADTRNPLLSKVVAGDHIPRSVPEEDVVVVMPHFQHGN